MTPRTHPAMQPYIMHSVQGKHRMKFKVNMAEPMVLSESKGFPSPNKYRTNT